MWWLLLLLPWQPWRNREVLEAKALANVDYPWLDDLTVLIPARNEAPVIRATLESLAAQAQGLKVILVDDGSNDGTSDQARQVSGLDLTLIQAEALPKGWSGKLWALEQGMRQVNTPKVLLLDADIRLHPGMLAALMHKMRSERLHFVSIMARLQMNNLWEKLLMPAFIYFFKLLYPFHLANSAHPNFAAAAGGCILLETKALNSIGGFSSIRDALIDDCTLAKRIKRRGFRTWIGLSHGVESLRNCDRLQPIWEMVTRTAYTQLRYSPVLLFLCTVLMVLAFLVPAAALLNDSSRIIGMVSWAAMAVSYCPTLRFYRLNLLWSLALPVVGGFYLAMVWDSASRYWRGERSRWKGRIYTS